MRIFAAFLLLVSFAVISDAAANELQNGGSILTPCGKYIPGKIEFCKKFVQYRVFILIYLSFCIQRFSPMYLGSNIRESEKTLFEMCCWLCSDHVKSSN